MSLNKVLLIGNLGKDPDVRYLDTGVCVATFSLATTKKAYTAQNGHQVPARTEWHNIVTWRNTAQFAEKYLHKGEKVFIEGELHSRKYEDQAGIERTVVEIYAEKLEPMSAKQNGSAPPPAVPEEALHTPAQAPQQAPAQTKQSPNSIQPQQAPIDFSAGPGDDLPF